MTKFNTTIFHPAWVTGFIDGEGTFYVGIYPKNDMATGYSVSLEFSITQHIRDTLMMQNLVSFFGFGYLAKDGLTKYQLRVRNVEDLVKLFTLFDAYPLQSQKQLDALAFRQVLNLVLAKQHLTEEGLQQIRVIKASMNRARMLKYKVPS